MCIIKALHSEAKRSDVFLKEDGIHHCSTGECIGTITRRVNNIADGRNFRRNAGEVEMLAKLFNISEIYFREGGELIELHGITESDWRCKYKMQKHKDGTPCWKTPQEREESVKKVEKALKELEGRGYVEKHYDMSTAVYHIHYYFKTGVACQEVSTFNKFLENLKAIKVTDWKKIGENQEELKEYLCILKKHYEYVSAYVKYQEYE